MEIPEPECEALSTVFRRTGATAERNAKWLLRFIQMDLTTVSGADEVQLVQEFTAVSWLSSFIPVKELSTFTIPSHAYWLKANFRLDQQSPVIYAYPRLSSMQHYQAIFRSALTELLKKGTTRLPAVMVNFELSRTHKPVIGTEHDLAEKPLTHKTDRFMYLMGNDESSIGKGFLIRMVTVLADTSDRIVQCPRAGCRGCLGYFVKARVDQTFCSASCGSAARMARKYAKDAKRKQRKQPTKGGKHGKKR